MHLHFPTTCIPVLCSLNATFFILHHPLSNFPEHSFAPQHHLFTHFPTFPSLASLNHFITSRHQFTPSRNHSDFSTRQKVEHFHGLHVINLYPYCSYCIPSPFKAIHHLIICFDTKCQLLNVNLVVNLVEIPRTE